MPRNRNLDDVDTTKPVVLEEDYLDVDKPLPGQNFYCISFVSPDKVLNQKEQYFFHHYVKNNVAKFRNIFNTQFSSIIDKCEDGTVDISQIIALKKQLDETCNGELVSLDAFKEKYEDFKFADEEKLSESFDKSNNFQTSVRGVKVRGVFDSKREADVRAAVLQRQDPSFDVFIGQVGYWCPWEPNAQKIQDIEYLNNDLNKLVKEYKNNEVKKDMFYQEQKTQRQKDALSVEERLKHKEGIAKTIEEGEILKSLQNNSKVASGGASGLIDLNCNSNLEDIITINQYNNTNDGDINMSIINGLNLGDSNSTEISIDNQANILAQDDPWLQRQMSNAQ
jgi:hypothetical protein